MTESMPDPSTTGRSSPESPLATHENWDPKDAPLSWLRAAAAEPWWRFWQRNESLRSAMRQIKIMDDHR